MMMTHTPQLFLRVKHPN
jgi:hypothetical protein